MFTPAIDFAFECDLPPGLLPIPNGCERGSALLSRIFPKIHDNRLAGGEKFETLGRRDQAIRSSQVLSKGKKGIMRREIIDCGRPAMVEIDFDIHRIGFEINQSPLGSEFRPRQMTSMQIEN